MARGPFASRHHGAAEPAVIELRIRELAQLFNSLDPSPFHERDLDDDAEDYIVGWARELPHDVPLRLLIYLPEKEAARAREIGVATSLANYFSERAAATDRDLNELMRHGWRYLSIGLPVLAACLTASQLAGVLFGANPITRVVEESLIIVGWVANWKPIETFLYDRWPLVRRATLYRRLAAAKVELAIS